MNLRRSYDSPRLPTALRRWLRFVVGLTLLSLVTGFFMSGVTPPGFCGEVLRHNQSHDKDASAIFYTDIENMSQLEADLRRRLAAREHGQTR